MTTIEEKFLVLPTTGISDALKGYNHMDTGIKPLKRNYKMAGRPLQLMILQEIIQEYYEE